MFKYGTRTALALLLLVAVVLLPPPLCAQPYGPPDRGSPGDAMIQAYLQRETAKIAAEFANDVASRDDWESKRPQYAQEYYYMLGLSPRPHPEVGTRRPDLPDAGSQTPLEATVTGTVERDDYAVELLHYQSRPRLYVTGNLYRPKEIDKGVKLPAVFYVCGHSGRGRNGNKVAYQSHGIWFARHGYICLVVDSLQLGEIAAIHHGTYRFGRWWWHSRGYTPAGVEAHNGVRGIDYLASRPDVDPRRIAVTGISGGGAATFWIAAADERVKVAVPVSGMADLESYVPNRVINGHCDCMFLYNTFRWPWTRIAGLIAPRPLLFVNSNADSIFPMDANDRVINRLERLYSLYGAGDRVDAVVSVGGHAYRQDIRQAAYRFINMHLKDDPRPVTDSEVDIVSEGRDPGAYPIPPESLRVFPTDADIPADELNTTIDEHFVPLASPASPEPGKFDEWKEPLLAELRRVSFGYFPETIPPARLLEDVDEMTQRLESEEGIEFRLQYPQGGVAESAKKYVLYVVNGEESEKGRRFVEELTRDASPETALVLCEPRGIGATKWTTNDPPNYVERSHVLLGRTVDAGRVWDVIAAAKFLAAQGAADGERVPVHVAGHGAAGLIGAYAAVLSDAVTGVTVQSPPNTHMDNAAPQFLNVLRVCDVPDALGMIAPRTLSVNGADAADFARTQAAYAAADSDGRLEFN